MELNPELTTDVVLLDPLSRSENTLFNTLKNNGTLLQMLDLSGALPEVSPRGSKVKREDPSISIDALCKAIQHGHTDEVARLIDIGTDIHKKDNKGLSALDYANFFSMEFPAILRLVQNAFPEAEEKEAEMEIIKSPFVEKIVQCQQILSEEKYDESDPCNIRFIQNAILSEMARLSRSPQNVETHAAIVSLLRMTVLAPNTASLQLSLRNFFRIREKLLLGQPEDYCFQSSPLNQACLNLAKTVFPSEEPLNVLYHTTLTENREMPWANQAECTDKLPALTEFYRSSLGTIELYEWIVIQAIASLKEGNRKLENIWQGTDAANNNKFKTPYYALSKNDLLILSQRSPAFKRLVDYSKELAGFVDAGDVYGKFNDLREWLKQNDVTGSGQDMAAGEAIYAKLQEFSEWWNQLGSTEGGKRIQNEILDIAEMKLVLDALFITSDKPDMRSPTPGPCIHMTGSNLSKVIRNSTEKLKKLSKNTLRLMTEDELDGLQKQILKELENPFNGDIQTGLNAYQHALKIFEEIPEIIQDPAFSYQTLEYLAPAFGQLKLTPVPDRREQANQLGVEERYLPLLDDPAFGGFATWNNGRCWYPVEIISQDGNSVNIRYLDNRRHTATFGVNDRSRFIPANVSSANEKTQEIRRSLIQNLLQNGDHKNALHYCQIFIKSGSFTVTEKLLIDFVRNGANLDFLRGVTNEAIDNPVFQSEIINLALAEKDNNLFARINALFHDSITENNLIKFMEFCTDIDIIKNVVGQERSGDEKWVIEQMRLAINRKHPVLFDNLYQLIPVVLEEKIEIPPNNKKDRHRIFSMLSWVPELIQDPEFNLARMPALVEYLKLRPASPREQAIQLGVAERHLPLVDHPRFGGFSYAEQNNVRYWFPVEITHQDGNQVTVRYLDTGNTHTRNVNDRSRFIPVSVPSANQQARQLRVNERHLPLIDDPNFGGFAKYRNISWYPVEIISQDGGRVNVRYLDDRSITDTFGVNDRDHFIPASVSPSSEDALEIRSQLIQNLLQNGDHENAFHYCQMFIKSGTLWVTEELFLAFVRNGANLDFLRGITEAINNPAFQRKMIDIALDKKDNRIFSRISEWFPGSVTENDLIRFMEFCTDTNIIQTVVGKERSGDERWIIEQMRLAINRKHPVLFDNLYQLIPVVLEEKIEIPPDNKKDRNRIFSMLSLVPELIQDPEFSLARMPALVEQIKLTPDRSQFREQASQLGVNERHFPLIDDPHFGGFAKYGNNNWYPVEIISQDAGTVNVLYLDDRITTGTFVLNDRSHFISANVPFANEKAQEIRSALIQNLLQNGDHENALHYCQIFIKSGTFTIIEPLLYNFYQVGLDPYLLHNALQDVDPEWLIKAISHAAQNRESEFVIYMARCFPETMPDFVNENPRIVAQLIKAGVGIGGLSLLTHNKINNNNYLEKMWDFARFNNDRSYLLNLYIQFPQYDFPPVLMAEITEYLLTSESSEKEKAYTKVAEAITASDLPEASTGWADLYRAIWEMSEYSKKIENKAPEAARDFKEFALILLKKTNAYHMTAEKDKNYSVFETDLKQSIEKKMAGFRHRHFSWFKTFAVILGNVLAALTVIGAICMIKNKKAIFHMPATTREKKAQEVIMAVKKIGRTTLFDQKEQVDKYSNEEKYSHNGVPHTYLSDKKGKR